MEVIEDIPYRCPRCRIDCTFSSQLKSHMAEQHTYSANRRQRLKIFSYQSSDFMTGRHSPILQSFHDESRLLEEKVKLAKKEELNNKLQRHKVMASSPQATFIVHPAYSVLQPNHVSVKSPTPHVSVQDNYLQETVSHLNHEVLIQRQTDWPTSDALYTAQDVLSGIKKAAESQVLEQNNLICLLTHNLTEKENQIKGLTAELDAERCLKKSFNGSELKEDQVKQKVEYERSQKKLELEHISAQANQTNNNTRKLDQENDLKNPGLDSQSVTSVRSQDSLDNSFEDCWDYSGVPSLQTGKHQNSASRNLKNQLRKPAKRHEDENMPVPFLSSHATNRLKEDRQNLILQMKELLSITSRDNENLRDELVAKENQLDDLNKQLEKTKSDQNELMGETFDLYKEAENSLDKMKQMLKLKEAQLDLANTRLDEIRSMQEQLLTEKEARQAEEHEMLLQSKELKRNRQLKNLNTHLIKAQQEKEQLMQSIANLKQEKEQTQAELRKIIAEKDLELGKTKDALEGLTLFLKTAAAKESVARKKLETFVLELIARADCAEKELKYWREIESSTSSEHSARKLSQEQSISSRHDLPTMTSYPKQDKLDTDDFKPSHGAVRHGNARNPSLPLGQSHILHTNLEPWYHSLGISELSAIKAAGTSRAAKLGERPSHLLNHSCGAVSPRYQLSTASKQSSPQQQLDSAAISQQQQLDSQQQDISSLLAPEAASEFALLPARRSKIPPVRQKTEGSVDRFPAGPTEREKCMPVYASIPPRPQTRSCLKRSEMQGQNSTCESDDDESAWYSRNSPGTSHQRQAKDVRGPVSETMTNHIEKRSKTGQQPFNSTRYGHPHQSAHFSHHASRTGSRAVKNNAQHHQGNTGKTDRFYQYDYEVYAATGEEPKNIAFSRKAIFIDEAEGTLLEKFSSSYKSFARKGRLNSFHHSDDKPVGGEDELPLDENGIMWEGEMMDASSDSYRMSPCGSETAGDVDTSVFTSSHSPVRAKVSDRLEKNMVSDEDVETIRHDNHAVVVKEECSKTSSGKCVPAGDILKVTSRLDGRIAKSGNELNNVQSTDNSPLEQALAVQHRVKNLTLSRERKTCTTKSSSTDLLFENLKRNGKSPHSESMPDAKEGHFDSELKLVNERATHLKSGLENNSEKETPAHVIHKTPTALENLTALNKVTTVVGDESVQEKLDLQENVDIMINTKYVKLLSQEVPEYSEENIPNHCSQAEQDQDKEVAITTTKTALSNTEEMKTKELSNGRNPVLVRQFSVTMPSEDADLKKFETVLLKPAQELQIRFSNHSTLSSEHLDTSLLQQPVREDESTDLDSETDLDMEKLRASGGLKKGVIGGKICVNKSASFSRKMRKRSLENMPTLKDSSQTSDMDLANRARRQAAHDRRVALFCIFLYLDTRSLGQMALVCKEWRRVSRHPALWKHIVLKYQRISSKYLITISKWCTQISSLTLEGLRAGRRRTVETLDEYQCRTRGCLELGLEELLKASQDSMTTISIIACGHTLTDKCMWLVSGYCRLLQHLTYMSDLYPVTTEVMWALGGGCPSITSLIVPPVFPCHNHSQGMTNRCLQLIAQFYPDLQEVGVGGHTLDITGLAPLVQSCRRLQFLGLDHTKEITEETARALCNIGLRQLKRLELNGTPVSESAISTFYESCRHLTGIRILLTISDFYPDHTCANRQMYQERVKKLEELKSRAGLGNIFCLRAAPCD